MCGLEILDVCWGADIARSSWFLLEAVRPGAGLGEVSIVAHGRIGVRDLLILVRMMLGMEPIGGIYVSGNALVSFVRRVGSWRGAGARYRFEGWEEREGLLCPCSDLVVGAVAENSALTAWAHYRMDGGDPERRSVVDIRAPLVANLFEAFPS